MKYWKTKIPIFAFLLIHFFSLNVFSQLRNVNGFILDSRTGERLIGATLYDSVSGNGSISNAFGYFSIKIKQNQSRLICSYLGYSTKRINILVSRDTILNIKLEPRAYGLEEVVIEDNKQIIRSSTGNSINLPIKTIKHLPSLMGEIDVLKALLFLPGVQSGVEGTVGLYVRGGSPDQNLILLDGVPVYNPDHFFGFVSIFNSDALRNVSLLQGGFPARYGGRLSSIVDISMKEGNLKETHGEGNIGLISSKIMLEGPILKDKSSYLLSFRRSWIDLITNTFLKKKELPDFSFYDLTAKVNYIFSDKKRLYFSLYAGKDKIQSIKTSSESVTGNFKINQNENQFYGWGNIAASLRYNQIFSSKLFNNTSLNFSNYRYYDNKVFFTKETNIINNLTTQKDYESEFYSRIQDISLKSDFDYQPIKGHSIKFGVDGTYHFFTPKAQIYLTSDSSEIPNLNYNLFAMESSIYLEDEITISSRINVNTGLRFSGFYTDKEFYSSLEPRLSGRYRLNKDWFINIAYSRMKQYIHFLTSSRVTFPTDLWVPSTAKIKPQFSDQFSLGSSYSPFSRIEINFDVYYKSMHDIIEYSEGSSFLDNSRWESKVETNGYGRAYGIEVFMEMKLGKTNGWLGYTLAKSERRFDNISLGNWYPYKYDRRHNLSLVINHKFSKNIDAGFNWEFSSGSMVTLISQVYDQLEYSNNPYLRLQYFESRNNYRLPPYHRLDFALNFRKEKEHFKRTISLNIYNVYNHKNIFFIYSGKGDNESLVYKKYTLFPILPSISYSLSF